MIETEDINRVYFANQWWRVKRFEWHDEYTTGMTWARIIGSPLTEPYAGYEDVDTSWVVMIPINQLVAVAEEWNTEDGHAYP